MNDANLPDPAPTRPLSEGELTTTHDYQRSEEHLSVVIYFRDGLRVLSLGEGESVVVGRSYPADITIRDPSLSRQHACFSVEDEVLWVEDLQSTNGTWIDGERIERREISVGAELTLGATIATVQMLGAHQADTLGPLSHDGFLAEVEEEIERARTFRRDLSLLIRPRSR